MTQSFQSILSSLFAIVFSLQASLSGLPPQTQLAQVVMSSVAPTSGLVSYWSFNEGSGTTVRDSAGGNTGTITGATWTTGKIGGGLLFRGTGSGDQVNFGNLSALKLTSPMSVSAWVKMSSCSGPQGIFNSGNYSTIGFGLYLDSFCRFGMGVNNKFSLWNNVITVDQWYFVTAIWDGANTKLYVDAVERDSDPAPSLSYGTESVKIGVSAFSSQIFNGIIDEVRIYNRALSAQEVTSIYTDTSTEPSTPPPPPTPVSDTTPPTIFLATPSSGSTVSATTDVSANATDNVGVVGVQFKLDGSNLGTEDTSSPYSISWDTTQTSSGSHTLTATARDAAGNQTTSSGVVVTVNNTAPNGSVIQKLTSFWEMNVNNADRIAWDSKGNAHGTYFGTNFNSTNAIFGSGWYRGEGVQTPYNSGGLSVPGALVDSGTGSFAYCTWVRRGAVSSDPIMGRWGGSGDTARRSWNLSFNATPGRPTLTYQMTNGSVGSLLPVSPSVASGDLVMICMHYNSSTGELGVSGNGQAWTKIIPSAPFQTTPPNNACSHPAGIYDPWYPCTLDFSHIRNQFFPTGSSVVGRTMFWNGYVPTDTELSILYNNGLGRDASYFGLNYTQPTRPLTVSLVNASFASDASWPAGEQGLYWLRPYPLKTWSPSLASQRGNYVWMRSTDHGQNGQRLYLGYSNSPEILPTSWTIVSPPRNMTVFPQLETPHLVWNPDTNLFHLYAHGDKFGTSNPFQQETLVWTSPDLVTWSTGVIALPTKMASCPGTPCYNHTGYAIFERNGPNNWTSHSLIESYEPSGNDKFIKSGLWSSANGINWTFVRETEAMNPKFPYRNQQNQRIGSNVSLGSLSNSVVVSANYVSTPYSQFEFNNPAWPLFFHDGTGINNDWLQDTRAYEENGTVYVYAKWNFREPSVVRLYKGTIQGFTPPPSPTQHTINASAGTGGTITPVGSISVNTGSNQTYTITPSTGYSISQVTVDGVNQGAVSSYTFTNVITGHMIAATFSSTSLGGGIKNIKTDFGATCNGAGNDNTAFTAFNTWALNWQKTNTGLIELTIPSGSVCMFTSAGGGNWFAKGIKKLKINGTGATLSDNNGTGNGYFLGGRGIIQDNVHSSRVASVQAGMNTVTLKNLSESSRFTVGNWAVLTGLDMMGYGYPPNPAVFEYVKIVGINSSTGVVTFESPLKNSYKSTWPTYWAGNGFEADQGGPATLYALDPSWDTEVEYVGLTFDGGSAVGQVYPNGKSFIFRNVTTTAGASIIPTQNQTITFIDSNFPDNIIEMDKMVEKITYDNVTVRSIDFQSSSIALFELKNSRVTNRLTGTPKKAVMSNSTIAELRPGPIGYGAADEVICTNCVINSFIRGGYIDQGGITNQGVNIDYTVNGGVIAVSKANHGPVMWAVPGVTAFFGGTQHNVGAPFTVLDVSEDGTKTYISTSLTTTGFPKLPLYGGTKLTILPHPAPKFTCTNCTGDPAVVDLSQAPAGAPLYSYTKRTYTGNLAKGVTTGATVWGKLVKISINVTKPYTGSRSTLTMNPLGQFYYPVVKSDGTEFSYVPAIDLKQVGERIITPTGVTGQKSTDSNLAVSEAVWFTKEISPFLGADISAEPSSVWPTVTIEIITDQSISTSSGGTFLPPPPPPVDITPPVISSPSVTTTATTASIVWNTDEAASTKIEYGVLSSLGYFTTEQDTASRVTAHSVQLSNLQACSKYRYKSLSTDAAGNSAVSSAGSFTTKGCPGNATILDESIGQINKTSGGSLSLSINASQGFALSVPANFTNTTGVSQGSFQIKRLSRAEFISGVTPPTGKTLGLTHIYQVNAFTSPTTIESSFATPLNLTVTYSDEEISGFNESTLKLYRYDGSIWQELINCVVTASSNSITCPTTQFSTFVLGGDLQTTSTTTTTTTPNSTAPVVGGVSGVDQVAPVISGSQSVTFTATNKTISITTNELATCRLGDPKNEYINLPYSFTPTQSLTHVLVLSDSSPKTYTARCEDLYGTVNTTDFLIQVNGGTTTAPVPPPSLACTATPSVALTRALGKGSKGNDVTVLQNFLITKGYLPFGNASGFFGSLTEKAVQDFQKANKLVTSGSPSTTGYGNVGPGTRKLILQLSLSCVSKTPVSLSASLTRALGRGSQGNDVTVLQNFLISKGYLLPGNNNGFFGLLTEAAVKAFQKKEGIVSTGSPSTTGYGNVGPGTRAKINALLSSGR